MADLKISQLSDYNYQTGSGDLNIDSIINTDIKVPVVVGNENKKLNIGQIFQIVKQYFQQQVGAAVETYIDNHPELLNNNQNTPTT